VVVVVPGAAVVVVAGKVVALAEAACMNASTLRSAMANDTTTGATNAPLRISRFRVARLPSSKPSRAPSRSGVFSVILQMLYFSMAWCD